jgi:hypothetical protein
LINGQFMLWHSKFVQLPARLALLGHIVPDLTACHDQAEESRSGACSSPTVFDQPQSVSPDPPQSLIINAEMAWPGDDVGVDHIYLSCNSQQR